MYFHRQCSINHKNQEVESIYFLWAINCKRKCAVYIHRQILFVKKKGVHVTLATRTPDDFGAWENTGHMISWRIPNWWIYISRECAPYKSREWKRLWYATVKYANVSKKKWKSSFFNTVTECHNMILFLKSAKKLKLQWLLLSK